MGPFGPTVAGATRRTPVRAILPSAVEASVERLRRERRLIRHRMKRSLSPINRRAWALTLSHALVSPVHLVRSCRLSRSCRGDSPGFDQGRLIYDASA